MSSQRPVHEGPLTLDNGTFGRTEACRILVEKLNAYGDQRLASAVTTRFSEYFSNLKELMKLKNPTRDRMMRLWHEHSMELAQPYLRPKMEAADIAFSYFENITQHRLRQGMEHAAIIERMCAATDEERERDYKVVLNQLVEMERRREKW